MTRTKTILSVLAFLLILIFDQGTKILASKQGIVTLNTGVSFGLFPLGSLTVLLIGVWIFLLIFLGKQFFSLSPIMAGVFFGASGSNLLDRLVHGGVRDFLFVPILNVQNNVADWAIFLALGVILLKMSAKPMRL